MALNRNNRQKARSAFFGNNSGLETSKYSRSFYVGEDVKDSDIHASYKDGTLCLEMPKPEAQQQVETKHQIAIEG